MILFEQRRFLVGDSFFRYPQICYHSELGQQVGVVVDSNNKGVFEFLKDYAIGCESLEILTDPKDHPISDDGKFWSDWPKSSKDGRSFWTHNQIIPLRKPLPKPVEGPYFSSVGFKCQQEDLLCFKWL